jgi:putative zinc finger protein
MVGRESVNCEQVWSEISNYVDGDVDAALRASMDEHFHSCKRCASVLAGTQNVVRLYGDERMLEVPAGFSRRLEKRLAQGSIGFLGIGERWSSWSAWLVPVAALALFAGGLKLADKFIFNPPAKSILSAPGHDIPPDMQVVISDGSKIFHVAGCPFIHDKATERTITAKDAMQDGYVPCTRCLRQYLKTGVSGKRGIVASDNDSDDEQDEKVSIGSITP